ncbi:MAG: hypothetical protein HYY40_10080 [Bacteroidetes bacterium]|nr:hypothetical protein [Bacteroidota bacterium]
MNQLLETAIKEIKKLPFQKQGNIAALILDELRWEKLYTLSQDELGILANEALEEYNKGETKPLRFK